MDYLPGVPQPARNKRVKNLVQLIKRILKIELIIYVYIYVFDVAKLVI